jgi:acetoin utilization protein AcuB
MFRGAASEPERVERESMNKKLGAWSLPRLTVKRHMTPNVITVRPDTSVWKAWNLLQTHEIGYLPVIQGGRLVGIISDGDLRLLLPSSLAMPEEQGRFRTWGTQVKVDDVMTRNVVTVTRETRTDSAAQLMVKHHIGCMPVLRGSTLVGIITSMDVLRALADDGGAKTTTSEK